MYEKIKFLLYSWNYMWKYWMFYWCDSVKTYQVILPMINQKKCTSDQFDNKQCMGCNCLNLQDFLATIDCLWPTEAVLCKHAELNILLRVVEQSQSCSLFAHKIDWNVLSAMRHNISSGWKQSIPSVWSIHSGVVLSEK